MAEQKSLRIIFTDKARAVFADILKRHVIEQTSEEFGEYIYRGKESRAMVVRKALEVIAKKTISEEKLVDLLQKHAGISKELAETLLKDIKEKLFPLLLIYPSERFDDPSFREEIAKKIFGDEEKKPGEPRITPAYIKKVEIEDVEKSAEEVKRKREITAKEDTVGQKLQRRESDKYRESVE